MHHQHIIKTFFDSDLLIQLYQSELGKIRDTYKGTYLHHHSLGKINLQCQSASSVCSMGNIIKVRFRTCNRYLQGSCNLSTGPGVPSRKLTYPAL